VKLLKRRKELGALVAAHRQCDTYVVVHPVVNPREALHSARSKVVDVSIIITLFHAGVECRYDVSGVGCRVSQFTSQELGFGKRH